MCAKWGDMAFSSTGAVERLGSSDSIDQPEHAGLSDRHRTIRQQSFASPHTVLRQTSAER
jgi:hypothetical protein